MIQIYNTPCLHSKSGTTCSSYSHYGRIQCECDWQLKRFVLLWIEVRTPSGEELKVMCFVFAASVLAALVGYSDWQTHICACVHWLINYQTNPSLCYALGHSSCLISNSIGDSLTKKIQVQFGLSLHVSVYYRSHIICCMGILRKLQLFCRVKNNCWLKVFKSYHGPHPFRISSQPSQPY